MFGNDVGLGIPRVHVRKAALFEKHENVFRAAKMRAAPLGIPRAQRGKSRERGQPAHQPEANKTAAAKGDRRLPVHKRGV